MKTVILVLCGAFFGINPVHSQEPIDNQKHSITIEPLTLFLRTISLAYTYEINDSLEIRINPRISIASNKDNLVLGIDLANDPYWYYDSYMLQIGLRKSLRKRTYIEPIIYYSYGSFDDRILQTTDSQGDSYDQYQALSRQYHSGGLVLRSGFKIDKNHFRFNVYYGLGYYLRYYHEVITDEFTWSGSIPGNYPITSDYWKGRLSIHLGIELGYRF